MKQKSKQTDKVTIAYMAIGIAVVIIMAIFGIGAFLKVNSVVVDGAALYRSEQVAAASGISKGDSMMLMNKSRISEKIISALPYVETVEITKKLPDVINITITESTAIAYIPYTSKAIVINAKGRVLAIGDIVFGGRIEVQGNRMIEVRGVTLTDAKAGIMPAIGQGFENNFNAMVDLLTAIEYEGIGNDVDYIDVSSLTNISMGYMDMYRVLLGGLRDYRIKITKLAPDIALIRESNPRARGTYNMTDPAGQYRFIPDD